MTVWIAVVALACMVWALGPRSLTYLVLMRVPVLALLFILFGPYALTSEGSELFWNLFIFEENVHLAWAITLAFASTWVCVGAIRIYVLNGPERYGVELPHLRWRRVARLLDRVATALVRPVPGRLRPWARTNLAWILMGLLLPLVPSGVFIAGAELVVEELALALCFAGAWTGFLFVIMALVFALLRKLRESTREWGVVRRIRGWWSRALGPWARLGYVDEHGHVLDAHVGMAAVFGGLFVCYLWGYEGWYPGVERAWLIPPTIGFVLMLVALLTALLSGITFFLDRFRIPLLAGIALSLWLIDAWRDTDHYYEVFPAREGAEVSLPDARDTLAAWSDGEPGRPIVIVCAEGGGIQAASWTARALTGLHGRYGWPFTGSIRMVSGVSGGSVGLLHFLRALEAAGERFGEDESVKVVDAASTSALAALSWGLLYPDFLRVVAPWYPIDVIRDRSWALEEIFRDLGPSVGSTRETPLSRWVEATRDTRLPAIAFNATSLETGGQLLFKTVSFGALEEGRLESSREFPVIGPMDFFRLYPGRDVDAVTAARLSATFPYVTPAARAREAGGGSESRLDPPFHVVDGGYFDNAGVSSAALWLLSCFTTVDESPDGRSIRSVDTEALARCGTIYLIWLRPFPRPAAAPETAAGGWTVALLGPVETLLNTRTSSQIFRNHRELEALQMLFAVAAVRDKLRVVVLQPPPADDPASELPFSLSWHLTQKQIQRNVHDWSRLVANDGLRTLDEEFRR